MLKTTTAFGRKYNRVLCWKSQNILCYKSRLNESNTENVNQLFSPKSINVDSLEPLQLDMLTRSDFGFYQKLLPIDSVQELISSINFLFDIPYYAIILALPFITKSLITMPIHIRQQKKYESRLPTLGMAVYEICKMSHCGITSRKRGVTGSEDNILNTRKQIHTKYGYNVSFTQLLPYTAVIVQLPIHLTMYVSLNTFEHLSSHNLLLPLSIGCTMTVTQYFMYKRNVSNIGINQKSLLIMNMLGTVLLTGLSFNWYTGFNLYILSNLSAFIMQQTLMNSDIFRNMVGLHKYCELQPSIRKLQIIYEGIQLSTKYDKDRRTKYVDDGGEKKSAYNVVPQFERTWNNLLQSPAEFVNTNAKQEELDAILDDIANADDIAVVAADANDVDADADDVDDGTDELIIDEEDIDTLDNKQYSLEFDDRNELNHRRKQIQKTIKNTTMRSFLMAQKEESQQMYDGNDHSDFVDVEEEYQEVTIHDVDSKNMKKK